MALVGIGDDAAVLEFGRELLIWTIDTSVENVHFRLEWLSLRDVGTRSFHAAVSDVAAMGGRPVAALSNLVVPRSLTSADVLAVAEGQAAAAKELRCPVVGGNLSRGGELSVTTAVLGRARKPLLRSGAVPGDDLWLVGNVGLARAGLLFLSRKRSPRRAAQAKRAVAACVGAWRNPRARIGEALALAGAAHAAIDVSDGLSTDAAHLAEESRVRVVIEEQALRAALPRSLEMAASLLDTDALGLALQGGEDYALLATGPGRSRPRCAERIGRVEKGRGVVLESGRAIRRIDAGGFDHFR